MRLVRCILPVAAALLTTACPTGPSAGSLRVAHSPRGVLVDVRAGGHRYSGELLEVRDTAFVVLLPAFVRQVAPAAPPAGAATDGTTPAAVTRSAATVLLLPFLAVKSAKFNQVDIWYRGGVPSPVSLMEMRQLARFPHGLPAEQMARLLSAIAQQDLVVPGS